MSTSPIQAKKTIDSLNQARFYAILDTGYVAPEKLVGKCRDLIAGGADLIQLRAKRESRRQRYAITESLIPIFESSRIPLVINDDVELAAAFPDLGLHIGQDDTPPIIARESLGPNRIIGLSTHSLEQAKRAIDLGPMLSYFAVGPVYATPTKPEYQAVGTKLVHKVSNLKPPTPFFCIGGIKRQNVAQVIESGAERIVAVSDVLNAQDTAGAVREFKRFFL